MRAVTILVTWTEKFKGELVVTFNSFSYVVNWLFSNTVHHVSVLLRRTYANSSNAIPQAEGGIPTLVTPQSQMLRLWVTGAVRCENGQIRTLPVRSPWNRTVAVRFFGHFYTSYDES